MAKKNDVFVFSKTNVSNYVQNKMGLSYLNWAFVVDTLKSNDPNSTYEVKKFPEINMKTGNLTGRQVNYNEGVNGEGAYVTVTVTFRGKSHTESLPCYDFKGRAVRVPDVMLCNKTIKRCYTKAAAMLTGLGIGLYINGNTDGDGHRDNAKRSTNAKQNYVRTSFNKKANQASRNGAYISDKQAGYLKGLIKQTKSDGSKSYEWLEDNYHNLNTMSKASATRAIKYLKGLKAKQKQTRPSDKIGSTGNVKQTTLIK